MILTDKLCASGEDVSVETMNSNNSLIPAETSTERVHVQPWRARVLVGKTNSSQQVGLTLMFWNCREGKPESRRKSCLSLNEPRTWGSVATLTRTKCLPVHGAPTGPHAAPLGRAGYQGSDPGSAEPERSAIFSPPRVSVG